MFVDEKKIARGNDLSIGSDRAVLFRAISNVSILKETFDIKLTAKRKALQQAAIKLEEGLFFFVLFLLVQILIQSQTKFQIHSSRLNTYAPVKINSQYDHIL